MGGGCEEAGLECLEEIEVEDTDDLKKRDGERVTKTWVVGGHQGKGSLEAVLLSNLQQRLTKDVWHWVWHKQAGSQLRPLRNKLSIFCKSRGDSLLVWRLRGDDLLARCEVIHERACAIEVDGGERNVETPKVFPHKISVMEDDNTIIDWDTTLRVSVSLGVSSKVVADLNHNRGDIPVLERNGSIHS